MNKYLYLVIVTIASFFTSCSNDDITIGTAYTVNVNASTVISSFIAISDGEFEAFQDSKERLRIRVLIYNENGELVAQDAGIYTNYNVQLKSTNNLKAGKYTVIGISDVVLVNGNNIETEFYKLAGESKLSEMTITDQGLMGYEARILGLGKNIITIKDNDSGSLNMDLKPGGALIYSIVWGTNWANYYGYDVSDYVLCSNKSTEALSFDINGDYTITERHETDNYFYTVFIDATEDNQNIYHYNFVLPMNNLKLYYKLLYNDEHWEDLDGLSGTTMNLTAGSEYVCHLDFYDYKEYYKPVTSKDAFDYPSNSARTRNVSQLRVENHTTKIPKKFFNQFNHVVRASDIE